MTENNKFNLRISSDDQMLIELWAKLSGKNITDCLVDLVKEKMLEELHENGNDFLNQIKNHVNNMKSLKSTMSNQEAIDVLEKRIEYIDGLYDMLVDYLDKEKLKDQKWLK